MAAVSGEYEVKSPASIKALPPKTVLQIASSQVLVDPGSVVKELIDNALDARATAIFVDITPNALDSIQVKDNGHGIPAQDRALVCRRHCTSKLCDFHQLSEIGGKWLGFRGEALASVANVSGSLRVVTRVEGEPVAVLLNFDQKGEVASIERTSHPVGTTVKVTDFFKTIPVRKQEALKHSVKFLAQIRRLMQAYALARPAVRFQLRVQKAKTDRGNFVYAPKTGANVEDAAFKVIGRDCAMQCHWSAMESDGFEVHAFLPKPDAIAAKFSNEGAFISVDSRPLASCRGTSKKMVSLLKTTLHRANPALDSVKNPFFCVNIICPPKSYDPNIEPAKDDVLFEDPDTVLGIVEKLLRTFYLKPNSETPNLEVGTPPSAQIAHDASSLWFNVYENEGDQRTSPENEDQQWRMNMYGEDEEDLHLLSENQPHILEDEEGSRSAAISNPWTIAKMNTPIKPKKPAGIPQLLTPAKDPGEVTITSSSLMLTPSSKKSSTISPLTPQTLSQLNVMQGSVDGELQADIQYAPRPREQSLSREASHYEEDIDLLHQTQLGETPSNVRELNTTSSAPRQRARMPSLLCQISGSAPLDLLQGRQAHTVPEAPAALRRSQRREQNIQNKAFKPPAPASEDLWFGQPRRRPPGLLDSPSKQSACTRLKRIKHPEQQFPTDVVVLKGPRGNALNAVERLHDHLTSENNTDIRDFFGRNTGRRRPSPTALVSDLYTSPTPRKHSARDDQQNGNIREHMRVFAQSEALSQPPSQLPLSAPESDASFSLQDISHSGNATAGPSHPRSRSTASYLRRTRSSKLPLERTPSGYYTQNIILPLSFSVAQLNTFSRKLDMSVNSLEWACPPEEAYDIFATPVMDAKVMEWAEKIDGMLDAWFEREKDAKSVMRFVAEMMQGKLQQRSKEDEEMLPV